MTNISKPPLTIFMHIPKTAGTSLREYLTCHYGDQIFYDYEGELRLSNPNPAFIERVKSSRCKAIIGHLSFGVHEFFPDYEVRYATFLRSPVQRVISHCLHVAREPRSRHYALIRDGMKLGDFIRSHRAPEQNNHLVRLMSADKFRVDLWPPNPDDDIGQIDQVFAKEHLDISIFRLRTHFDFIGIVENFSSDLVTLVAKIGQPDNSACIPVPRLNEAPSKYQVTYEELAIITQYNKLDIAIYEDVLSGAIAPKLVGGK